VFLVHFKELVQAIPLFLIETASPHKGFPLLIVETIKPQDGLRIEIAQAIWHYQATFDHPFSLLTVGVG
jgi:hypothetical protein